MKTRKILAAAVSLAIAATAVAGLAACGVSNDSGDGGHVHSFDETKWSTSEKGHWHPATCGHDFALGDYADHTMVSGECTVCHYQSGSTNPGDGGSTVPDDPNVPDDPILEDSPMWFKRDSENSEAQNLEIVNDLGGASGAHYRVTVDLAAGEAFYFYLDNGDGSEPDYESFKLQYITTNGNYFKTVGDYGNLAANGGGTYQFDIYVGTESDLAASRTAHIDVTVIVGGDIGGGGDTPTGDVVLAYSVDGTWATTEKAEFTLQQEDYEGVHYSLELELTQGTQFYLYENVSESETKYCNHGQLAMGNDIFDASEANEFGTKNFIVRETKSYTFDFYNGTIVDGNSQPAHFDAKVTGSDEGGGGGTVTPGDGQSITVHYHNTNSWTTIGVYSYIGQPGQTGSVELLGGWPGAKTGIQDEGDGWVSYTFNAPEGHVGTDLYILFNNGLKDGAAQTGDILVTYAECWIAKDDSVHESKDAALAAEGTVTEVTYTFYFYNAKGWSDVNIYTYGCYQLPWGTVSMTTATDLGEKWYQYSFTAPESKIKGKELSVIIYNPKNQDAQRVSIGDTSVSDSGSPITMDSNTYYISGAGNGKWSTTKDGISTVALYAMLPVVGKFYLGA